MLHVYFVIEDHYLSYSCWMQECVWVKKNDSTSTMTCDINVDVDMRHHIGANVHLLTMCHKNWLFIKFMVYLLFDNGDRDAIQTPQWWAALRAKFPSNRQISNNIMMLSFIRIIFYCLNIVHILFLFFASHRSWLDLTRLDYARSPLLLPSAASFLVVCRIIDVVPALVHAMFCFPFLESVQFVLA